MSTVPHQQTREGQLPSTPHQHRSCHCFTSESQKFFNPLPTLCICHFSVHPPGCSIFTFIRESVLSAVQLFQLKFDDIENWPEDNNSEKPLVVASRLRGYSTAQLSSFFFHFSHSVRGFTAPSRLAHFKVVQDT